MEWLESWLESCTFDLVWARTHRDQPDNNYWQKEVKTLQTPVGSNNPAVAVTLRLFDEYLDPFEYWWLSLQERIPSRVLSYLVSSGVPDAHLVALVMACAGFARFWRPMLGAEADTEESDTEDGDRRHAWCWSTTPCRHIRADSCGLGSYFLDQLRCLPFFLSSVGYDCIRFHPRLL